MKTKLQSKKRGNKKHINDTPDNRSEYEPAPIDADRGATLTSAPPPPPPPPPPTSDAVKPNDAKRSLLRPAECDNTCKGIGAGSNAP